ncbi:MAG: leucyl aminopeptidase [Burkholderiaceae bacterium]|jgi:leucyl aminopeptidase|nr:leucyl aminopeptidase [Burkholderiaceae bacterium]
MDFQLKPLTLAQAAEQKVDVLIVLVAQGALDGTGALAQWVRAARQSGDLPNKPGPSGPFVSLYHVEQVAAPRLLIVSTGDGQPASVRKAVGAAVAAIKEKVQRAAIVFAQAASAQGIHAAVLAAAEASYAYTTTCSKPQEKARRIRHVCIGVAQTAGLADAFAQAKATVAGIELAKEWANRPANHCTPALLAQAAKALAKSPGMHCAVLGPGEVAKLGMGAFLGVAQGSHEPLRFIVLRYQGAGAKEAPVVLVGKGITFDSGGVSLKPAAGMDEMKFDMSGGACVLGVFHALGQLGPRINAIGLIPACENMGDGHAIKPGDVLTSLSGQTIEVLNTDAEGRLILCDALSYARRFKPAALIDIATLTGACGIALGAVRSGLFSSDEALAADLLAAGEAALDPCWRLPLDEEYAEELKSNFADIANVGGRLGGAITAAKFLQKFTADLPWAHLDIAGTAWKSGTAKGSTGRPVGLLLEYLLTHARRQRTAHGTSSEGESAEKGARKKSKNRKAKSAPVR